MSRPKGTGCIYQRPDSSVWWIKYSRNGKDFRESTHTDNKRKAEKMLKHRLAELETGTFPGLHLERVRVAELAEDFLRDYRINHRRSLDDVQARWSLHLRPFFAEMRTVDVSSGVIAHYVDVRQQEKAANATINRELAALKRMFRLAQQGTPPKVLRVPVFPRLKEDNTRTGFLNDAQRDSLASQCAKVGLWLRAMYEVGCTYGWRVSEVKNLRVRHVDIGACTIRLDPGTTKNGQGRVVTFERESTLYELLSACVHDKSAEDFTFTRDDGKPVRVFRTTWKNVCARAGVPGLLFHDLRRTAARNLRRAGVAENVIMQIGGWRTRNVFDRYAIITENDIVDAVRKLEADRKQRDAVAVEISAISHESVTKSIQVPTRVERTKLLN
jgi:integrase